MIVTLTRVFEDRGGTFGILRAGDLRLMTLELPWRDNAPNVSCIPPGEYEMQPETSERFGETWFLVGGTVARHPDGEAARTAVCFHVGNFPSDTEGCPLVGHDFRPNGSRLVSSREAMDDLRDTLTPGTWHRLLIVSHP